MASSSELWRGGKRKWRIAHEARTDQTGLRPKETCRSASRRSDVKWRRLSARQAGTRLALTTSSNSAAGRTNSWVGFKHDEVTPGAIRGAIPACAEEGAHRETLRRMTTGE